jgi:hypothetical protein
MRWLPLLLVSLAACGQKLAPPAPADRVTVHASWALTGGTCPTASRVAVTAGGITAVADCSAGALDIDDLDPATNQATARLLDAASVEIQRASLDLANPVDRAFSAAFAFTLPQAFGPYRVRLLWAIAGAPPTQMSCDQAGAQTVHVVFGPRPPVDVACATGFAQFDNAGGDVSVQVDLRGAGGAAIASKSLMLSITDTTQTTIPF